MKLVEVWAEFEQTIVDRPADERHWDCLCQGKGTGTQASTASWLFRCRQWTMVTSLK